MQIKTQLRLCAAAACLVLSAQSHAASSAPMKIQFHLEAQPLSNAVTAWAKQSGLQLIWPIDSEKVISHLTPKVNGLLSPSEALSLLLAGTGLTYTFVDSETVAIRYETATAKDDQASARTRLARANERDLKNVSPGVQSASRKHADGMANKATFQLDGEIADEVVVTGSHIRGIQNKTVPLTILDRNYIESGGYSTTTQLVDSLPQNLGSVNQSSTGTIGAQTGVLGNGAQGSSVNLRGIGQGTTLILVNGRRMAPGMLSSAVDVSALPLSAIERVEVLTDGASALYGSDAVGGVINFVLRDDFEGAETRLRAGWARGVHEQRASQAAGASWESGTVLGSVEYYKRDLLRTKDRDFVPSEVQVGSLMPEDENFSAMVSGKQRLSEDVGVFADALFIRRDSFNLGDAPDPILGYRTYDADIRQSMANVGMDWRLGNDWRIEIAGNYAKSDAQERNNNFNVSNSSRFEIAGLQTKADGSLFELPGGSVRGAVGAEWRDESYESHASSDGFPLSGLEQDQIVRSVFTEIYIPVVGTQNSKAAVRRLELSLAGRYDDYSSFGSSVDPQIGVMWEPMQGWRLRGSYGTSYKPPNLVQYDTATNIAVGFFTPDPVLGRDIYILDLNGANPDSYSAQESESFSIGLDFDPPFLAGLKIGVGYYHIRYTDRISQPVIDLANVAAFGSLITRDPTDAQVRGAIAAGQLGQGFYACDANFNCDLNPATFTPIEVITDARFQNLAVSETSGFDVSFQYGFRMLGGEAQLGLGATRVLEMVQQVTSTSASTDSVGFIYNSPDWKVRSHLGWQLGGWTIDGAVTYVSSTIDNRRALTTPISSYTAVDARLAYDFGDSFSGLARGLTVALSSQNLFDRNPPRTRAENPASDLGFDPTNASPLGRVVALEISKAW